MQENFLRKVMKNKKGILLLSPQLIQYPGESSNNFLGQTSRKRFPVKNYPPEKPAVPGFSSILFIAG